MNYTRISDLYDLNQLFYIHDKKFFGITFSYSNREFRLEMLDNEKRYILCFGDVLAFDCALFDPWGPSPYILNWEISDMNDKSMNIELVKENWHDLMKETMKDTIKDFKHIIITLTSGNIIRIMCRYVGLEAN